MFKVLISSEALDDLRSINPDIALRIKNKIDTYLAQSPKKLGKQLNDKYRGLYRYRYGNYRVLYEISILENTIIIIRIGHCSGVYSY